MARTDYPQSHRRHISTVLSVAVFSLILSACVSSRPPARAPNAAPLPERLPPAGVPLGVEVRPVRADLLGDASYDLPVEANTWVESELNFLLGDRREVVSRWIERGDHYAEFVKAIFRAEGIPTDLYHLGMIESGFIPTAVSPAGAAGMWQIMPATSRDLALRVDSEVDERLDPVRSTRAAARHLRSLYRIHGDWALAAAAYNAGSTRVRRSLERYGARNFWDLASRGDLAAETRNYVPRLYAMTIISRNRGRYGINSAAVGRAFAFDSIHVDRSVSIAQLAQMTGLDQQQLATLNPHLRAGRVPAGGYWVWVSAGTGTDAQRAWIAASQRREQETGTYTVRWGDTLGRIAQLTGVGAATIREMNPEIDFDRLLAGARIRLPATAAQMLASRSGDDVAAPAAAATVEETGTYTVRWGDTLSRIAQLSGVSSATILDMNPGVDPDRLITGTRLRMPTTAAQMLASRSEGDAVPAAPAAAEETATYTVRWGDTFSRIAQSSGVNSAELREMNPDVDPDRLIAGTRLRLPSAAAQMLASRSEGDAVPAAPAAAEETATYTVRWGDTFGRIAQSSGVSSAELREMNPGVDPDRLITGTRLRLPAPAAQVLASRSPADDASASDGGASASSVSNRPSLSVSVPTVERSGARTHVVAPGETLWAIAQRYQVSIQQIREENSIDGEVIRPGQSLRIPGGTVALASPLEHVVEPGDTLWEIAQRYGSSVEAIRSANGLGERAIRPGQRLEVPATP